MVFITVGSRTFPFDRLIRAMDESVERGEIQDSVYAQIGTGEYKPIHFPWTDFLDTESFQKKMQDADLIVTHGGTGVIVNALKMGKKVVAVPRLKLYGEAVDDHQLYFINEFEQKYGITGCYECRNIGESIRAAKEKETVIFRSEGTALLESIDAFLQKL